MDAILYFMMLDKIFKTDLVLTIVATIAAAAVTDLPPVFLSHSFWLKRYSEKSVLKLIIVSLAIFFFVFVCLVFLVRVNIIPHTGTAAWGPSVIQILVPIGTSFVSLAINYLSYDPAAEKVKRFKKIRLNLSDKVAQLLAVIVEIDSQPNYAADLDASDKLSYTAALARVDALGAYYRSLVRDEIAGACQSPAGTTDLSVPRVQPTN